MSRPRIRTIKPEALQHRKVGRLSHLAFRLWIGFITQADDEGRMIWDADQFRILVFGYHFDVTTEKTISAMTEITSAGLARLYTVNGIEYISLPSWREHQKINRPMPSTLPGYEDGVVQGHSVNTHGAPRESSRSNHYGSGSGSGSERIYNNNGSCVADATAAVTTEAPVGEQQQKPKRRTRAPRLADPEWVAAVEALPVYAGLDVDQELGKLDAWLLTPRGRGKTKSRQRIVNWLNNAVADQREIRLPAPIRSQAPPTMSKAERYGYVDFDKIEAEKKAAKGAAHEGRR